MHLYVLLAVSAVGCPWTRSCQPVCCETIVILPCTPTVVVTETVTKEQVQAEAAIASTDPEQPIVTEATAAEEVVTEPVGLSLPGGFPLAHMALDWGVADIGAGTLFPTSGILGSSGAGFWGNPGADPPLSGFAANVPAGSICCHCISSPQTPSSPIPEPASVVGWLAVIAVGAGWMRRHRGKLRKR